MYRWRYICKVIHADVYVPMLIVTVLCCCEAEPTLERPEDKQGFHAQPKNHQGTHASLAGAATKT